MPYYVTKVLPKVKFYAYVLLAVLAIVVFPLLGILGAIEIQYLLALISLSLGSIIALLLEEHVSTFRKAFLPGLDGYKQIGDEIERASEIWMLSYTSVMWIRGDKFGNEFQKVFSNGRDNRVLVYDPESKEYESSLAHQTMNAPSDNPYRAHETAVMRCNFLRHLLYLTNATGVTAKVIDHMPSWNLLIFNPTDRAKTRVFVVLKAYSTNSFRDPHIFSLAPRDGLIFEMFLTDYDKMWVDAKEKPAAHWSSLLRKMQCKD